MGAALYPRAVALTMSHRRMDFCGFGGLTSYGTNRKN
jgi:hypothetical protein